MNKAGRIKPSLLISTYNWPQALTLIFQCVLKQTYLPSEVIIADDGSNDHTKVVIDEFRERAPFPVIHVWHEDKGFRKCAIMNEAIRKASSPYIIEIDGDILMHARFIEDHMRHAKKGYFLSGGRATLNREFSEKLQVEKKANVKWYDPKFSRWRKSIRFPMISKLLYGHQAKNYLYGIGANISFWKEDLLAVNGYDEMFEGWGEEDRDLMYRLFNLGIKKRSLRLIAICYHLYHKGREEPGVNKNTAHFKKNIENKIIACEKGIVKKKSV